MHFLSERDTKVYTAIKRHIETKGRLEGTISRLSKDLKVPYNTLENALVKLMQMLIIDATKTLFVRGDAPIYKIRFATNFTAYKSIQGRAYIKFYEQLKDYNASVVMEIFEESVNDV